MNEPKDLSYPAAEFSGNSIFLGSPKAEAICFLLSVIILLNALLLLAFLAGKKTLLRLVFSLQIVLFSAVLAILNWWVAAVLTNFILVLFWRRRLLK